MTRRLRVVFVGLGRIFDLNVRGYLDHSEADVAALCDAGRMQFPSQFANIVDAWGTWRHTRHRDLSAGQPVER